MTILFCTLAICLLLLTSAMISGSEIAFFSISENFLDTIVTPSKKDPKIKILLNTPRKLLATILIVNNFVNILTVVLFAVISQKVFLFLDPTLRFLLEVVIISFFILLFGEVLPKIYAERNPLSFARAMVTPVFYLQKRLHPVIILLDFFTRLIEKKIPLQKRTERHTSLEIKKLMHPISDAVGVYLSDDFRAVHQTISTYGFLLYPVFKGEGREIIGYIKAVDLLRYHSQNNANWHKKINPFFEVALTDSLQKIYTHFKNKKNKLVVILNPEGKQVGFVTKSIFLKRMMTLKKIF